MSHDSTLRPFVAQGHYTEIHDAVFDVVMPMCPPNAWKILCFVIRKTKGWRKDTDALSYSQIRKGCGISSDATIRKALDWLTDKEEHGHKLLNAVTSKDESGRQRTTLYSLNRDYELEKPSTENEEPTTETVDGLTTETVDGLATETVETIPTPQYPHSNNQERVENEVSTSQSKKPKKLKVSDEEAERQWEALLEEDDNAAQLEEFAEFTAGQTKSGERKIATLWRQIGKPYVQAREKHGGKALAAGLAECLRREKPDIRYAVAVARNWTPENVTKLKGRRKDSIAVIGATDDDYSEESYGW